MAAVLQYKDTAALQCWLLAPGPGHTKPETINQRWLVVVVTGQIVQTTAALQHRTCSHQAADPLLPETRTQTDHPAPVSEATINAESPFSIIIKNCRQIDMIFDMHIVATI